MPKPREITPAPLYCEQCGALLEPAEYEADYCPVCRASGPSVIRDGSKPAESILFVLRRIALALESVAADEDEGGDRPWLPRDDDA